MSVNHAFVTAAILAASHLLASCSPTETRSAAVPLVEARLAGNELVATPIGDIRLEHNYFDNEAAARLYDELDYQRAVQAYLWALPLVSFAKWEEAEATAFDAEGGDNIVVHESLKEKSGILTPNYVTTYFINFTSLKDGPLVIEYPAGKTAGGLLDFWQRPVADVGLTGPDRGKGGRYVIVGPGEDPAKYAASGTYVIQSATVNLFFGLRILDRDPAFYARFKETLKVGRLGKPLHSYRFVEGKDVAWDGTPPRDLDFWRLLSEVINDEPVREIDKPWMAMLLPLGIEKGKPFAPDARQTAILRKGAAMGELMSRNIQVNPRYKEPYWPGTHWYNSLHFSVSQETDTRLELDERTTWFYEAVATSEGMVNPTVGTGQVYMTTKRDSKGETLRADRTYRLHVPPNVPAKQWWALTLYSENTRRPYDNGGTDARSVEIFSGREDLKRNPDGSVDLYVGAKAPPGMESNYLKTTGTDGWFVYFRLYAPSEPFFDKSYALPDFERIE